MCSISRWKMEHPNVAVQHLGKVSKREDSKGSMPFTRFERGKDGRCKPRTSLADKYQSSLPFPSTIVGDEHRKITKHPIRTLISPKSNHQVQCIVSMRWSFVLAIKLDSPIHQYPCIGCALELLSFDLVITLFEDAGSLITRLDLESI